MNFLREEKTFANSEGSYTVQTLFRNSPNMNITAVSADNSDFQTRASNEIPPRGLGYEHVIDSDFVGNATKWGEEAVQKLSAKPVEVGRYDLVLHPSHLWLTIHESRRASDGARSRARLRGQLRRHELRRRRRRRCSAQLKYGSTS